MLWLKLPTEESTSKLYIVDAETMALSVKEGLSCMCGINVNNEHIPEFSTSNLCGLSSHPRVLLTCQSL